MELTTCNLMTKLTPNNGLPLLCVANVLLVWLPAVLNILYLLQALSGRARADGLQHCIPGQSGIPPSPQGHPHHSGLGLSGGRARRRRRRRRREHRGGWRWRRHKWRRERHGREGITQSSVLLLGLPELVKLLCSLGYGLWSVERETMAVQIHRPT